MEENINLDKIIEYKINVGTDGKGTEEKLQKSNHWKRGGKQKMRQRGNKINAKGKKNGILITETQVSQSNR